MSSSIYRSFQSDQFPNHLEISFRDGSFRQTLIYEKVTWEVEGQRRGLRYGENPDQPAALYRMVNGNLCLGEVECIEAGNWLASDAELLQSGKHPGKINITDADAALNILRYLSDEPAAVIVKHNNPSGVALRPTPEEAYLTAFWADPIAAFGGTVALNRPVDLSTAEAISERYVEVICAPEYEQGVLDQLKKRKNLRIMRIANMDRLRQYVGRRALDLKSLIDGGLVCQWSYVPRQLTPADLLPASAEYGGKRFAIERPPTESEKLDMIFGWYVESGVTSNSVIYVKDRATVSIGTGEQDRVGVAEIARDKAFRKLGERIAQDEFGRSLRELSIEERSAVEASVESRNGGLAGSTMISDGFFPFRDGVDVGLRVGVSSVVQPGGSIRDFESIEACNEYRATMVFTGQRSFKH
ncbi:MAG: IMP cyclohydrolase [Alkalispirochaetaceae bacterium]